MLAQATSQPQHIHWGHDGNRLGGGRCERKQRRSRSLVPGQPALKKDWLIDDVAASEVADRHDQPCATVAVEKIELDGIRPSAAVPPFGMSPEPSSIKPGDMPERARHPARGLSRRRKCRQPTKRTRHPARGLLRRKKWPARSRRSQPQASARSGNRQVSIYHYTSKDTSPPKSLDFNKCFDDFV